MQRTNEATEITELKDVSTVGAQEITPSGLFVEETEGDCSVRTKRNNA